MRWSRWCGPAANEAADVLARGGVDLPALGRRPPPPAAPPIRGNRIARGGVGSHHVARPRRAAPRHQVRTPDGAPRPGGDERWLGRAVIVRGRSDIAIVLPPGWRPRDRRRRLRANFDRNRLRNPPRDPAGRLADRPTGHPAIRPTGRPAANLPPRSPRCNDRGGIGHRSRRRSTALAPAPRRDAMVIESGEAASRPRTSPMPKGAPRPSPCPSISAASTSGERLPTA